MKIRLCHSHQNTTALREDTFEPTSEDPFHLVESIGHQEDCHHSMKMPCAMRSFEPWLPLARYYACRENSDLVVDKPQWDHRLCSHDYSENLYHHYEPEYQQSSQRLLFQQSVIRRYWKKIQRSCRRRQYNPRPETL